MENTTFEQNKKGCHLDMDEDNDVLIYLVSFLGSLAVLPGNIISALFMEKIGRVKIIGEHWSGMEFKTKQTLKGIFRQNPVCNTVIAIGGEEVIGEVAEGSPKNSF